MAVNRKLSRPRWNRYPARALSHQLLNPCFIACPTFPTLFRIYPRYYHHHHHHHLFCYLEQDKPSFFPSFHIFPYVYIYPIMLSSLLFETRFQMQTDASQGESVSFRTCVFSPWNFSPRFVSNRSSVSSGRNCATRVRSEAKLRCEFRAFFLFFFLSFSLSLFPPSCLAAFPPPSGWREPHSRHK